MLIVLTTTSNQEAGESLAAKLVEAGLAACVQILPRMTSVYMWEGRVTRDGEHLLLIKTLPETWDELEAFLTANHTYTTPEIVAIETEKVSGPYLAWMKGLLG
jgi:periplasmic divalent cation tolerance protein